MTADKKPNEQRIIVHAHVDLPEAIDDELSAETQQKLTDIAQRAADVARVVGQRGQCGEICISVTDRQYDRVVESIGRGRHDRRALDWRTLDERKRRLEEIVRPDGAQNVMLFYAARDLPPILDRLVAKMGDGQRALTPKLLLGGRAGTRYDVAKTLFVLIQQMIPARHIRVDHDVDDPQGVALGSFLDDLDTMSDVPDVVSGVYIEPGEWSRIENGRIEPDDFLIMLNDFSTRTVFLAPVAPIVDALARRQSLDGVPAIPDDDEGRRVFVQDSFSFLNYLDKLSGLDQPRRVISGAYLTARDHVWDLPTFSLLQDNCVWCDDAAIAAVRGDECRTMALTNVVLKQSRHAGLGPTLADVRDHTADYLMRMIRGVVLLDVVKQPIYRNALRDSRHCADWPANERDELWRHAGETLGSLGEFFAALPHTVVGVAARGESDREFGLLKSARFVDPYFPRGILAAVREMRDSRPGDRDAPAFCQTLSQLIDDLLLYASHEFRATWQALCLAAADVSVGEVFPQAQAVSTAQS